MLSRPRRHKRQEYAWVYLLSVIPDRMRMKKGTRSFNLVPHILARLAGIEPTTPWFVAKYSIQLSYSRPMHVL